MPLSESPPSFWVGTSDRWIVGGGDDNEGEAVGAAVVDSVVVGKEVFVFPILVIH